MRWVISLVLFIFFSCLAVLAETPADTALPKLLTIEAHLNAVRPHVEELQLPRFRVLHKKLTTAIESARSQGLGHAETLRQLQELLGRIRFSRAFFKVISSEYSHPYLDKILILSEEIAVAMGLGKPYGQMTASIFSQIHQNIVQLENGPALPESLRKDLVALKPKLGQVIAVANEKGDRPYTFEIANRVHADIEAIIPKFSQVLRSHEIFDTLVEIQILAEIYAEFKSLETLKP